MSYELLAILLLVLGCGLIVAEVFIPSGGMILVMCILSFVASAWCAYKAWWGTSPGLMSTYVIATLILIPGVVIGVFRVLSNTRVGDRILLSAPELQDVTPYQAEEARLSQYIGKTGTTLTLLTPGGLVNVGGERLHAFSEGIMIPAGAVVEVLTVRGTRVLVRPARGGDGAATSPTMASTGPLAGPPPGDDGGPPPLDFDVPQG